MIRQEYLNQVSLLVKILSYIAKEDCFALKGGTAINLFYSNLPRLSVDIDLTYIHFDSRDVAYTKIMSEAASLVEVVHGVRMTPSLAFCGSDPMHLLPVSDLLIINGLV